MTIKRPCLHPSCPELTEGTYCEPHRIELARRMSRRGSTRKWRRLRERVLKRDNFRCTCPGCEVCEPTWYAMLFGGPRCGKPYPLEVDHVNGDPNDNRMANLQTLCEDCHREKHRPRDEAGSDTLHPYPNHTNERSSDG